MINIQTAVQQLQEDLGSQKEGIKPVRVEPLRIAMAALNFYIEKAKQEERRQHFETNNPGHA